MLAENQKNKIEQPSFEHITTAETSVTTESKIDLPQNMSQLNSKVINTSPDQDSKYKVLSERIFYVVFDHLNSEGTNQIHNQEKIIDKLMKIALHSFLCCGRKNMNFNEYTEHFMETHKIGKKKIRNRSPISYENREEKLKQNIHFRQKQETLNQFKNIEFDEELKNDCLLSSNENADFETKKNKASNVRIKCNLNGCGKSYTSENGLKYHLKNGHLSQEQKEKNFICDLNGCEKKYKNYNGLKYHKHKHHD